MKIKHVTFLDSISFMPMALRKLPEAFGLSATKSWYPHLFNPRANLNYVGSIPDMVQYGVAELGESENRSSCLGTMCRNIKSVITDACWSSAVRMTSPSGVRRVRYFVGILWMSETLIFF